MKPSEKNAIPIFNAQVLEDIESLQMPGESDIVAEIFQTFIGTSAQRLSKFLELTKNGDLKPLSKEAHAFKSSARTIGAQRLGNLLQQLESKPEQWQGQENLLPRIQEEVAVVIAEIKKMKPALA
jgi:HPt (histidine-containing phosphotransfer) domain-containing protein